MQALAILHLNRGGLTGYNPLMPQIEKHAPGLFNWIELAATDQNAAELGALFTGRV
jgi:hypothetical protein